jgi:hypothetical protein
MAGSKATFIYAGDRVNRLVSLDESNTRALGFVPATAAAANTAATGTELTTLTGRERYIIVSGKTSAGRPVSRRLVVPDRTNTLFVSGGTIDLPVLVDADNGVVELVEFTVKKSVGEDRSFANLGTDTGLDDGSQPA